MRSSGSQTHGLCSTDSSSSVVQPLKRRRRPKAPPVAQTYRLSLRDLAPTADRPEGHEAGAEEGERSGFRNRGGRGHAVIVDISDVVDVGDARKRIEEPVHIR